MPRNGRGVRTIPRVNGVYSLPPIYLAENGTTIMPNQHNIPLQDIASALTQSLPRDGSAAMTGNLPMNGRKVTGLAPGTAATDAATVGQLPTASPFLQSFSALTIVPDRAFYSLNSTTAAMAVCTAFGRSMWGLSNAAAARTLLGLGSLATANSVDINGASVTGTLALNKGGTGATTAPAARTALGLGSLATQSTIDINSSTMTGTLSVANGGTGSTTASSARTALGLGPLATASTIDINGATMTGTLTIAGGGTGATTAAAARTALGLTAGATATSNTQTVWNAGTDTAESIISASKLQSKMDTYRNANDLGWGQTWQDVSGSRDGGTTYTNSTSAPIQVSILATASVGSDRYIQVSTNGTTWINVGFAVAGGRGQASFVVPPGHRYRVDSPGGSMIWAELR